MSAMVQGDLSVGVPVRCLRFARSLIFGRQSPGWLAASLVIVFASPIWAQTFEPSFTVGAGIQTSYQHVESDATPDDQFSLGHARIYLGGDITKNISAMFNTDYSSYDNSMQILIGGGAVSYVVSHVQRLVRPFYSADRSR